MKQSGLTPNHVRDNVTIEEKTYPVFIGVSNAAGGDYAINLERID